MKKTILVLGIVMAGLFLPTVISRISAQSDIPLEVKIPFNFTVCQAQLPAGRYTLKHASSSSTHMLIVRGADNRSVDLACTNDIESTKSVTEGRLVFNRYGDQYFLSEAWWPGDNMGHELVKTDREKALIKEKPERVIIKIAKPKKTN